MKRDMDLIRLIMLKIEEQPFTSGWIDLDIDNYQQEVVAYHVLLLSEAGLIEAINLSAGSSISWKPRRLTWEGHEFLDAARDNNRWNQVKTIMAKFGGFVFDIGKQVLFEIIKSELRQKQLI